MTPRASSGGPATGFASSWAARGSAGRRRLPRGPCRQFRRTAGPQPRGRRFDHAPVDPLRQPRDGRATGCPGDRTWAWCPRGTGAVRADRSRAARQAGTIRLPSGCSGHLPVATPDDVLTAYLHQAALGMIGAGVRAIPVGHTHGQQVLAYLQDDIRNLVAELVDPRPGDRRCRLPLLRGSLR